MGLLDKLFDNREKKDYVDVCHFIYGIAMYQKVGYTSEFSDIPEDIYRADMLGIITSHLDTRPKERYMVFSWSEDIFMHISISQPREIKERYLPIYEGRHKHYSNFIKTQMSNSVNATTVKTLAAEVCRVYGIEPDPARINSIAVDINVFIDIINGIFETFRIV